MRSHLVLAKRVKVVSTFYLVCTWVFTLAFLKPTDLENESQSSVLILVGLSSVVWLIGVVLALVYAWRWLRSIHITASQILPDGVGLRQGWAFWSWVVPIVAFWFPPKIIRSCHNIFQSAISNTRLPELKLGGWWFFYLVSGGFSYISARTAWTDSGYSSTIIDVISALTLSIGYFFWIKVVDEVTSAQDLAIKARESVI